jgi:TP901 family phage tail tape measure protein
MASRTEYQLAIKIAGLIDSSLGSSCNLTKKQLKEIAKAASDASGKTVTFSQAMQNAAPGIDAAWNGLTSVVKTGAAALTAAGTAAVAVGKAAVDVGSDFDKAMSSWKGTAAATDAEYQVAREAAMKWGRETTKTATEGANALEYMALAGWNVTDSVAALPRILKLSEATDLDLARTSDLVTDSMSATGETIGENGDNLERFLNVATKANNKSNQTAEDLMEAWIETGGVFKNLGVDIEDSATALGVLANRGIKGSEAGTALNAVMVNLTTGTGQAGKMMEKLKLSAFDQDGKFKGLKQTLTELNDKVSTMTQEEQNATLAAIGGKMHVDALNDLLSGLNTTVEDGSTEWDNLNEELRDANGSLEQMANAKNDNLWGDQQILTSALQDAGIRLNDGLTAPLREATQAATELVYKAGDIADTLEYQYPTIKRVLKEGASNAEGFAQPLLKLGEFVVNNPEAFAGIATGLASSITVLKGAEVASSTAGKLTSFITAMGSSSGSMLLGGAALVAGGTVAAATATKIANMRKQTRSLKDHFGDVTLSLEDLSEAAENIIGKQTFERFSASVEQLDKVKELKEDLDDTGESIDRIVWKVQAGVDLSDSDKSTLEASIDSLVKESQEYITEKQYSLNLSVNALFGDDSAAGDSILSSMSGFYDNLNEDVAALGKELGDVYSEALEDGIIDVDEANTIQSLKERLQEITNGVENAKFEGTLAGIAGKYSGRNLDSDTFQNLQSELNETVETQQENIYQNMYSLLGDLQQQYNYSQSGKIKPGEAGYLTEAEFKQQQEQITSATNQQSAETAAKALGFSADTIAESYKSEIEAFSKRIPELTQQAMSDLQGGDTPDSVIFSNLNNIDKGDQLAIQKLVENVKPSIEELKESVSGLDTVPESIQAVFDEFELLEAAGGDTASIISLMAKQLGTEEERDALIASAKRAGLDIPNNIAKGVKENASVVSQAVNSSFGSLAVNSKVDVGLQMGSLTGLTSIRNDIQNAANNALAPSLRVTKKFASGGVVSSPTFAEIGEGGDTEFVIPMNSSKRSADLWRAAGEQLGAVNSAVNNSEKVVFSPVINVSGGASESMVRRAINESYQTFESMIAEYEKTQRRVSM